jgi:hypothetical protein
MKRHIAFLIAAVTGISLLSASCGKKNTPAVTETPVVVSEAPVTEVPVTEPPAAPTPDSAAVPPAPSDYSYEGHTDPNEGNYTTGLANPADLANGGPVLAVQEAPSPRAAGTFDGSFDGEQVIDIRSTDVSQYDLSAVTDISNLTFNTETVFGSVPFDPAQILEYNKDPGLNVRELHLLDITGQGVGIAIIDQALLLEHEEYKDSLMYYERIHCSDETAQTRGSAMASIAVGKSTGVAPGAKLYYIASTFGHLSRDGYESDASIMADCIYRVLEINAALPDNEKIRVIAIPSGYGKEDAGADLLHAAISKADEQNIFVITTSVGEFYEGFELFGVNRGYTDEPGLAKSYRPAASVAEDFYSNPDDQWFKSVINFPVGSRTYASAVGPNVYEISRESNLSYAVPWAAGLYALCCQANPSITPEDFIRILYETAYTGKFKENGIEYRLSGIVNPPMVIGKIRKLDD